MKKTKLFLFLTATVFMAISCKNTQPLFEGTTDQWLEKGIAGWNFDSKVLVGTGPGPATEEGFIATKKSYKDFILEMEFYPDSTVNSGVFIRCENDLPNSAHCYEINIWDSNPNQDYSTGGMVNKYSTMTKVKTSNKWNTCKIKSKNSRIQVWVNGILTLDVNDKDHTEGYICLQARGTGEIKFRNINIQELN